MARLSSAFARALGALVLFGTFQATSCVNEDEDVESIYVVPGSLEELLGGTYYDQPFPSDLRLENGKVRFLGFPNPKSVLILDEYVKYINDKLDGFSTVAAGYLRFTGSIDPASLPKDGDASLSHDASVQLIDVTPGSPDRGKRMPITVAWHDEAGVYWPAHTLTFMPALGHPLRPKTTYALVVTDAVMSKAGLPIHASDDLREVLGSATPTNPARQAAHDKLAATVNEMNAQDVDFQRIAHFTSFTTNDPTAEYVAAAKSIPTAIPAPTADDTKWMLHKANADYDEYTGEFGPMPNFQEGKIPFAAYGDGGGFKLDASGTPQVVSQFSLRFSLSVPNATACPMPAAGYPIVLYAHGTGGDYRSYVGDGTGKQLAKLCLATMGIDQIFHGNREGAPPTDSGTEVLFFNFNNIESARTNIRQSGLEEIQRARLFTDSHMIVPQTISTTMTDIKFDATKLLFFGHSQGALNAVLYFSASNDVRGGVMSGASGVLAVTLLDKTEPQPSVAGLVKSIFLGLNEDEGKELSIDHPALSLGQTLVDTVDPIVYAHTIATAPYAGVAKSVYQTEGIRADGTGDNLAPPRGGEALAIAIGLDLQDPFIREPFDALKTDLKPVAIPTDGLSGNLGNGAASGVLAQWDPQSGEGHYVVFDVPQASIQASRFLKNLADDAKGRVPAP